VKDRNGLTIEAIRVELHRALRHGGRAAHLVKYAPSLVEMLCPPAQRDRPPHERALLAEEAIRSAIDSLGGRADVLAVVLGLSPGTLELTLEQRRQRAASALGMLPATFRRDRHEGLLLWDLATEIYRRAVWAEGSPAPGPDGSNRGGLKPERVTSTVRGCAAAPGQDLRRYVGHRTYLP
jgi:hypothetical protein